MKVFVGSCKKHSSISFLSLAYNSLYKKELRLSNIDRNKYGKPFLKNDETPSFNISHSGEYIACVFDKNEIGIDIQKIRQIPKNIVRKYLKENDGDTIKLIEEWTKYESYGKKMGAGIPFDEDYTNGHFLTTFEIENYVITVCTDNKNEKSLELIFL